MASIQKTAKGYRAQIKIQGTRDSQVFPTRREAVEWAARRESEIRDQATMPLGEQHTLQQALRKYAEEVSPQKRGERWEQIRLAAFEGYRLPLDLPIGRVTAQHIATFRDARGASVGPAAVLRELTLLSSVFEAARLEWGWVDRNPCRDIRKPQATKHRERVIQWWEIRRLLREMGYRRTGRIASTGEAVAMCMLLALRTGMRAGELCGLTWGHVYDQHVHLPTTKAGRPAVWYRACLERARLAAANVVGELRQQPGLGFIGKSGELFAKRSSFRAWPVLNEFSHGLLPLSGVSDR
ncbi:site-specific integrase [Bordetella hinzii]|uniref:site-specific integrase n=1 Tax=Bordetella hinzii TaxID=103855 RepID=UPI002A1888A1|nr:site-specific integrase [Bordetella hinzii]WPL79543.1 site-specific integrase [Bordetella hinzii]